jgi:CRISPR-associated protein Cas5d
MDKTGAVMTKSRTFQLRVRGPIACFTRPEMKVERMSYEVMTPSAARGIFEAIFWKPAIVWHVSEIQVGAPVDWIAFRRNEVESVASDKIYFAGEKDRAQRNTVALRNVDYLLNAHLELTNKASPDETLTKFEEMFHRRLQRGQHFHQPYLGCREFAAEVSPNVEGFRKLTENNNRHLGLMFFDFDFRVKPPKPLFFDAKLDEGIIQIPGVDEVQRQNGGRA